MKIDDLCRGKNNIFQSPVWAEFQKKLGREVFEIEGNYFYKEQLIRNKYFLYCPRSVGSWQLAVGRIEDLIKDKRDIVFARVEPSMLNSSQLRSNNKDQLGSHPSDSAKASTDKKGNNPLKKVGKNSILSQQYSPKQTLILDLTKSEEELLENMKPKHRYNIRLAGKKGVKVKKIDFTNTLKVQAQKHLQGVSDAVDNFYKLSLEVSKRDPSYSSHPKSYYEKMVEILGKSGNLQIFTAAYESKTLSSIIILFYKDTAIYLHGASSNENREVMPNHLAQWEAIKEAKKRGCKYYDFWGVAVKSKIKNQRSKTHIKNEKNNPVIPDLIRNPEKSGLDSRLRGNDKVGRKDDSEWSVDDSHAWAGVTKFKLGFVKLGATGEIIEFPGAYDLPINKVWYNGLSWLNRIRKLLQP